MLLWSVVLLYVSTGKDINLKKNEPPQLYLCLSINKEDTVRYIASWMSASFILEAKMYCPNPSEQCFKHKCPLFFFFFLKFCVDHCDIILPITDPGTCATEMNVYPGTLKHDIPRTTNKRHADGDGLDVDHISLNWSYKCFYSFVYSENLCLYDGFLSDIHNVM